MSLELCADIHAHDVYGGISMCRGHSGNCCLSRGHIGQEVKVHAALYKEWARIIVQ